MISQARTAEYSSIVITKLDFIEKQQNENEKARHFTRMHQIILYNYITFQNHPPMLLREKNLPVMFHPQQHAWMIFSVTCV